MSRYFTLIVFAFLVLGFQSCSMKEDRMECPCYVSVQTDTDKDCLVTFFSSDGSILERRNFAAKELQTGENYTKIRKGEFFVSVVKNLNDMHLTGGRMISCPKGKESAPIYCCSNREHAVGDDLMVNTLLQKQHAVVTLEFVSDDQVYPYNIKVSSKYNAMDLLSLEGCKGDYDIVPVIGADLSTSFLMTRQNATEPIYLFFLDKNNGGVIANLDLNYFITQSGYNWDAEYLGDITIVIDFARLSLSIEVEDWDHVVTFKFEI